jgi:hypothetical protein
MRTILHVELTTLHEPSLRAIFEAAGLASLTVTVHGAGDAADYLRGAGRFAGCPAHLPCCVLINATVVKDGCLPAIEGIRGTPQFSRCPVVIMANRADAELFASGYDAGANSCVVLEPDEASRVRMLRELKRYWIETNIFITDPMPTATR